MATLLRGVLRFRLLVLGVAAAVVALGIGTLRQAPVDVLPEFSPPYAEIQTEALGLSADEVEQLITVPLEADLLNGVEGVDVIRSQSVPGMSSIVLVFARGTDVYRARQLVEERLAQAHALPNVSRPPTLLQPLSSSNRVLMIGLSSDRISPIEQSVIARWTVRPRLMGVPGVANVSIWGMRDQQLQVQVDPERLRDNGVTLSQVIRSAGNAQVVSPLSFLEASTPGTGGFIETPQQRLQVRHLLEKIADPAELGKVPVEGTDGRLRLADVADIRIDHQPLIGDAVVEGGPGLMLVVEKFPGTSTLEVTEGVEDALEALRPGLSGIRTDQSVFRPAGYINDALDNLGLAVIAGILLALLVAAALRFHWRVLLLVLTTVPLSLIVAGLLLRLFGQGFNLLVLVGLAGATAVMVDEAIAPTDRVVRRLRQRPENGSRPPLATVIRDATSETRIPLGYATLIVLLAAVPVAVMGGRPGSFFAPAALAYAVAVIAAMFVAVTVTPALSVFLFAGWEPRPAKRWRWLRTRYSAVLARFGRTMTVPVVVGVVGLVLAVAAIPALTTSLVPTVKDRAVLIKLEAEPGTSNPSMTRITTQVAERIREIPGVRQVGGHIGRAVTGDQVTNVSSSEVFVNIRKSADYDDTLSAIEGVVADTSGVRNEVVSYAAQKVRDVGALTQGENRVIGSGLDVLTGSDKPLVVRVFGQDPDVLRQQADRIRAVMAKVDGVDAATVAQPPTQPTVEIEVDLDKAESFGLTPGSVRRAEATLVQGIQVGSVFQEQKVFDVIVQGAPATRSSVDAIRNLLIDRPGGGHVRLGDVADVRLAQTPAVIARDAVSRRLDITADVSGRSIDGVASELERRITGMTFPLEYHAEVLRQDTAHEIGAGRVAGFALAAAVAAFLLLQAAFRSWRLAGLLFGLLPAALVGGLAVAVADGADLSLGALIGLLVVFGLAVRGGLLLLTGVQRRERSGQIAAHADSVAAEARERLVPTLATTGVLALLCAPFVVLGSRPGLEVLHSTTLVLLGGLLSCAVVTLFVLPAIYRHLPAEPTGPAEERGPAQIDLDARAVTIDAKPPRQRTEAADVGGDGQSAGQPT
jgi:Cu/Ag efflux pump CusA